MPKQILERELTEASRAGSDGRIKVTILTPGWGSSGYYSPKVVEAAASLVQPGLPMYVDHPSSSERIDRPGRSVKDIAAKFTSGAQWTGSALEADAQLVPGPYREALVALEDAIGVSINGSASDIKPGEAEGRKGPIVEGLAKIDSVDFVTKAGRGGSFTALLESALLEADVLEVSEDEATAIGVSEATASDRMEHLRSVVRQTHGGDGKSAWVRDQDAEKKTVFFDVHDHTTSDPSKTFQQNYRVGDNDVDVALVGNPREVRPITQYVPVTTRPGATEEKTNPEEIPMGNIQVDEAEHRRVTEAAGRVPTLESERDAAISERDEARRELAESKGREAAVKHAKARVAAGNATLPSATVERIVAEATRTVPLTAEGALDEPTLNTAVDGARVAEEKYLAGLSDATGGRLTGFGESAKDTTEAAKPTHTPFGRPLTEQKGA